MGRRPRERGEKICNTPIKLINSSSKGKKKHNRGVSENQANDPSGKKEGYYFGAILPERVRDVIALYKALYKERYGCGAPVTGKARSKLADAIHQVGDVCAVKRAMREFMDDESATKVGHSLPWFVQAMSSYIAKAKKEAGGGKKIARSGDEDFEDEVRRFKGRGKGGAAEKEKRARPSRGEDEVRGRRRRRRQR